MYAGVCEGYQQLSRNQKSVAFSKASSYNAAMSLGGQTGMNRDPRLLYGADIRKRILDEVAADIARLANRRKVGRLVSVGIRDVEEIAVYIHGQVRAAVAVIDIGINQVTDADGNSRIVGDADISAVADIASWTTPVPGGVGPVTVAMLMRNAAIAFEKQIELGWV